MREFTLNDDVISISISASTPHAEVLAMKIWNDVIAHYATHHIRVVSDLQAKTSIKDFVCKDAM